MKNIFQRQKILKLARSIKKPEHDILTPEFYVKFREMCGRLGINPKDLLQVMFSESRVSSSIQNPNGKATGLIQFMPFTLKALGWSAGADSFAKLSPTEQLSWVEKYFSVNGKGRSPKNVDEVYQLVFLPGTFGRRPDPVTGQVILIDIRPGHETSKNDHIYYDANKGFDRDKKGYITLSDIGSTARSASSSPDFQKILKEYQKYSSDNLDYEQEEDVATTKNQKENITKKEKPMNDTNYFSDFINKIQDELSGLSESFGFGATSSNNVLVSIISNSFEDSVEFSKLLKIAINDNLNYNPVIHFNENQTEIVIKTSNLLSLDSLYINRICKEAKKDFTNKFSKLSIDYHIDINKKSNFELLKPKDSIRSNRLFTLKNIMEK